MLKSLQGLALGTASFGNDHVVAYGNDGKTYSWRAFEGLISEYKTKLEHVESNRVALWEADAVEFLAQLFAIFRSNKQALIAANNLPLTHSVLAEYQPVFWGDWGNQSHKVIECQPVKELSSAPLVVFTSGSTGAPVAVPKTFQQLELETQMFEQNWGESIGDVTFAGSVSHQHMYGLAFRLLWPFCSGRAFVSPELAYWENIDYWAEAYNLVLISSPPHLTNISWDEAPHSLIKVFSAGAPLPQEAGVNCQRVYRTKVVEIYGSTETGAVGARSLQEKCWQALPGVTFERSASGFLSISSGTVCDGQFESKDLCDIQSSRSFQLLGRGDNIAKIGGKRVSLTAIEAVLAEHEYIDTVKVLVLEVPKRRVGAVIRLSAQGKSVLIDQGRLMVNRSLARLLEGTVERVAIPRYWRYVHAMPVDTQGKTTSALLQRFFSDALGPDFGRLQSEVKVSGDEWKLKIHVTSNIRYFEGHFDGSPVLPGVVQTAWAIHYAREYLGLRLGIKTMENMKFQNVIFPEDVIELSLRRDLQKGKIYFRYWSERGEHSSGRLVVA